MASEAQGVKLWLQVATNASYLKIVPPDLVGTVMEQDT